VRTHSIFATLIAVTLVTEARADGFLFNGQSARGLGVMNACAAHADDPSAVVFNPGGLALMAKKRAASAGATLGGNLNGHFRGAGPGEERAASDTVPHAYLTLPVGERLVAGVGAYSMFRMRTEWSDPEHFVGRFVATRSRVESYDVAGALGYEVAPNLGVGAGVVYRTSRFSITRAAGSLSSDRQSSIGWNAGVLYRPVTQWSFALTHRNEIGVFPAQTTAGAAWHPSAKFVFEIDVNRTGWSRVRELAIDTVSIPLDLEDTTTLRAGFRHRISPRTEWHLGYAAERTAQPDHTVGPFMHDAPRSTYGAGIDVHGVDVAFSWSTDELRDIRTNVDGINGNYRRNGWLIAVTVTR
jgi:long-chain fatty acid transport protein